LSALTTAQQAPILNAGVRIASGTASIVSDDTSVCTPANVTTPDGQFVYAVAQAPGSATLTVSAGGRSGYVAVTVSEAPLNITLGTPEPK
jgi:hypothetical protein